MSKPVVVLHTILICFCHQVKNKMPAPVQITAEQLLREAKERELELVQPVSVFSLFDILVNLLYTNRPTCILTLLGIFT